ncbi:hypothetical protein WA1_06770 [Scytonema hofmannii PCC 7110]|uniref:Knr4/Smi1-like domain-containing protein n=1 Tax=Scytonema hofmannii PCC 7110 TaxID=128403 RepID=A0A139WSY1_9CYAN|nr:SMI1/KNR4 family protein [Scytonema hofmannii]KYC35523.1 hypothetical protein WA1_06770 [Scytonema hofmannii PCC 7110]
MYEWLEKEISEIKTRKFHVIKTPGEEVDIAMSMPSDIYSLLPPSYVAFLSKFGRAKLYRENAYYQVGILNPPQDKILKSGEKVLHIGFFNDSEAYFKYSLLIPGKESPVYECTDEGFEKIADSFEEWLTIRCEDARDAYTDSKWEEIWNGPKPFTKEEEAVVIARKQFQWQVVGFDENRTLKIAVKNNSNLILPYLTIGMRAIDPTEEGRIWESGLYIDISSIQPGQESVVEHHIHQNLFTPINTELFQVSDPLPEERDKYWEFQKLRTAEVGK